MFTKSGMNSSILTAMLNKGKRKYFTNPILGLIPFLVYLLIHFFTGNTIYGLLVALVLSAVSEISIRYYTKTTICGLMFSMTFVAALATLLTKIILGDDVHTDEVFPIFFEIYLVFLIITIRQFKPQINRTFFKKKNVMQKTFLSEFFRIINLVQYFFTIHIFAILISKYVDAGSPYSYPSVLYTWIPIIVILFLLFLQAFKIKTMATHLQREEWLPIVNERGEVSGKIARSVSVQMKNKFMHPVVRVALISDNRIYLQPRAKTDVLDPEELDHPFEKYLLFNEDINLCARTTIAHLLGGAESLSFRFSLKYVFENKKTKRLMFLFIAQVDDESKIKNLSTLKGKFWTMKQISQDMEDNGIFSECFQLEYEYLKNAYLMANQAQQQSAEPEL